MRCAAAAKICQSARASPGGSIACRISVIRRSELTVVPGLLRPLSGGQDDVRERGGLGRVVGVLGDHELRVAQRRAGALGVGHAHGGVGAADPDGLHAPVLERVEEVGGGEPGLRARSSRPAAPNALSTSRRCSSSTTLR